MIVFLADLFHLLPLSLIAVLAGTFPIRDLYLYVYTLVADILLLLVYDHRRMRFVSGIFLLLCLAVSYYGLIKDEYLFVTLIPLIVTICLLVMKLCRRYRFAEMMLMVAAGSFMIYALIGRIRIHKTALLMLFFYVLLTATERLQSDWLKKGDTDLNHHSVYILPFLFLIILILGTIELPEKPYDWLLFKEGMHKMQSSFESVADNGKKKRFDIGFSADAVLRGELNIRSYRAMDVFSNVYDVPVLKISGRSFDSFEDLEWKKTDESTLDYRVYDAAETLTAVKTHDENYLDTYRNSYIDIRYRAFHSAFVFAPLKAMPYIDKATVVQEGGDLYFEDKLLSDYKVSFYRLIKDSADFNEIVNDAKTMNAADLEKALKMMKEPFGSAYTIEGYQEYRRNIYEKYLKPVNISARTEKLLSELFKDAETDLDKLICLEKYLSAMTYDPKPGTIPPDVKDSGDYLDYLLFESQKGYCVHYASAFVLLARTQGIPARYVQGYSIPLKNGAAEVTSLMAHAWAEVYLDGFGWLDFEPTPPSEHASVEEGPASENKETEIIAAEKGGSSLHYLLLIPLFMFLIVLAESFIRRYRNRRLSTEDKIRLLHRQNLKLLKWCGFGIREEETLSEYSGRIADSFSIDISNCLKIYEELIYGERVPDEKDAESFRECNVLLRKESFRWLLNRLKELRS